MEPFLTSLSDCDDVCRAVVFNYRGRGGASLKVIRSCFTYVIFQFCHVTFFWPHFSAVYQTYSHTTCVYQNINNMYIMGER